MTCSRVDAMVALQDSPETYLARSDLRLAPLIERFGSCPIVKPDRSPFDVLASSIVSQQLSSKAARTIKERLRVRLGVRRSFVPAHFVKRRQTTLQQCGLSANKAAYLIGLARTLHSGALRIDDLLHGADAEVIDRLVQERGVGRWTAEMFLIFGLSRLDVLSTGDTGLRRAARRLYALRRPLTERAFLRLAEPWRPYRSVASWYLWQFIDDAD